MRITLTAFNTFPDVSRVDSNKDGEEHSILKKKKSNH